MRKLLLFVLLLILSCSTLETKNKDKEKFRESDNIEVWLLNAQEKTNFRKFKDAINILNEILVKFLGMETLSINYNIGFNFYKLNNYEEAKIYLNRVVSLFENSQFRNEEIFENRKYVVLAGLILDKIEKDKIYRRDPYHIQDDIKEAEKRRAKRPQKEQK